MLAHDRVGAGEPVVLLHGLTYRRQAWRAIVPQLALHHEVVTVDLPGHGGSEDLPPTAGGNTGPYADALESFFADAGLERPHVVGNSLGGLLALELAARGTVRSATALSPAGFWSTPGRLYVRTALAGASALLQNLSEARIHRILSSAVGRKALAGLLVAHPENIAPEDLAADIAGLARPRAAFPAALAALADWSIPRPASVPCVVGWGDRDRVLPPSQHRRLHAALPDAEIFSLPDSGHVPMDDNPGAVADLILYATHRDARDGDRASGSSRSESGAR